MSSRNARHRRRSNPAGELAARLGHPGAVETVDALITVDRTLIELAMRDARKQARRLRRRKRRLVTPRRTGCQRRPAARPRGRRPRRPTASRAGPSSDDGPGEPPGGLTATHDRGSRP